MQKILTSEEMREVDRRTTSEYGIPSIILMENAAHAAARVIAEKLGGSVAGKSFLILCGKGNNGGDGAALARILWTQGADVDVYLFGKVEDAKGDARINFEIAAKLNRNSHSRVSEGLFFLTETQESSEINFTGYDVVIDALFGTGLDRPVEGNIVEFIALYSVCKAHVKKPLRVSLDVPSGLKADSGEIVGKTADSSLTIAFTAPKLANVFPPASNFNGELVVANIGSPRELIDDAPSQIFLAEREDVQKWLEKTKLKPDSYKKTRGTALVVAGSRDYSGAAVLAINACFAAGAGMATVAVPKSVLDIVATKVSEEIITRGFAETENGAFTKFAAEDVLNLSEDKNLVALGCGLSSAEKTTREFVREIVENRKTPIVLDADGLNSLAPFDLKGSDKLPLILTPHIGEFKRLLGTKDEIENKIETARNFAKKHNVILVLKGERSLIAAPDGRVVINPTGNSGVSRAGSGDTLTGIITGFLAQTYGENEPNIENTFETVVAALYISGLAGDIAAENYARRLITATDIRKYLNEALERLEE